MARDAASNPQGPPRAQLTVGSVRAGIIRLAGPMLVGILSIMALNLMDTWFVGKLGTRELAAMSFTFPVVMLLGSVAIGLGTGATSAVARALGAGDERRVRRLTTDALALATFIVAVLSTAGYLTMTPVFRLLGATEETLPLVIDYMSIWFMGMACLVVPMVGNSVIRATGDARTPAKIMILAALLNGVLDPLLIFGWGPVKPMGIAGAAIATVIARAAAMALSLWVVGVRDRLLTREIPSVGEGLRSWWAVLEVGVPAAGTNLVAPVALGVLTGLVARYGEEAVAAFGAGGRVEAVALIVPMALGAALGPFVGQNWGAGRRDRVGEAVGLTHRLSLGWGLTLWGIIALLREPIAHAFTQDPTAVAYLKTFLLVVPAGHGLMGVFMSASSAFNAVGRPMRAAALGVGRALLLGVPLAWLGALVWDLPGLFGGMVVANLVVGAVAWWWTRSLSGAAPGGRLGVGAAPLDLPDEPELAPATR